MTAWGFSFGAKLQIHIDVHIHNPEWLQRFEEKLNIVIHQGEHLMALSAESKALLDKLNAATTKVSDRIDALLANPNTTEAEFRAALQPIADHLDEMGTDPSNPAPTFKG